MASILWAIVLQFEWYSFSVCSTISSQGVHIQWDMKAIVQYSVYFEVFLEHSPPDLASFQWDSVVFVWDYSVLAHHILVHYGFMASIFMGV